MKNFSLFLIPLLFFCAVPAQSYVTVYPGGSSASMLDAFTVSAAVDNGIVHAEITVWSVSGGDIDYAIDLTTLSFSGTCSDITSATLHEITEAIADKAITEGVSRGYPLCSGAVFSKDVRVWSAACAQRSGSGCLTDFAACTTEGWAYRTYEVYCPGNGLSSITQKAGLESDCSGSCEASYESSYLE